MVSSPQSKQPRSLLQWVMVLILLLLSTQVTAAALQPQAASGAPEVVSYQGQVTVSGQPYDGTGYFKFAVVDADGTKTYWSNDGTAEGEKEPDKGVELSVQRGLFTVLLGDTTLDGMTQPLSAEIFSGGATSGGHYLRVWFSADDSSYTQLSPDQRIAAVPFALVAQEAISAGSADQLDGQHASAFALTSHNHNTTYVNDNAGEVGDLDVPVGGLSADRISGTAWTGTNDGSGSGLDADLLDGFEAADLLVPRGTIVLGVPGQSRLTEAGYQILGLSNVTCINCDGFKGSWATMQSAKEAPFYRDWHTAVWTGTEMIVWGGYHNGAHRNDGGRYNPVTHTWTPLPTNGAPSGRYDHTAVWTGTEMIVWGGQDNGNPLGTGGRYNPVTNTWTPLPTADDNGLPLARRYNHTAVWTGMEMIVWGGQGDVQPNTGYRYDPVSNTWTPLSTTGAPPERYNHTAVWTGTEMIVWGGLVGITQFNDGGRYNPATDIWDSLPTTGAPSARYNHTAVWTGTEMIVWGGGHSSSTELRDGGRYNLAANTWIPLPTSDADGIHLPPRYQHTAVWTGTEMIVWGGRGNGFGTNPGYRYNPAANTWVSLPVTGAPPERIAPTAVWTGMEMIVWGGADINGDQNTVERYTLLLSLFKKP